MWFILAVLLILGWNWNTHKGVVRSSFNQFPDELKSKLSLPLMEDGSLRPDKDFKDFTNHSYPKSIKAINYWFNISKNAYLNRDYKEASISFGIASHYLSDSLAAPHSVSNEDYEDHKQYEDQALVEFKVKCSDINLEVEISNYYQEKKLEWAEWLKNKDAKYPEESSSEAANLVYSAGLQLFEIKCENKIEEKKNYYWILILGLILIFIIAYCFRRYF